MGTSASYRPTAVPECAYAPQMTRAQAIARRTAGTLDPNCVVIVTDGPVIGTAGNTSPTQIELNPVSGTDLGMSARVHTNFYTSAFDAVYDIDLGTAGTIHRMTDNWGNTANDPDANAPTVHTQVPWHKAGNTFRDNYFDDATLIGWSAAGGSFLDNTVLESTVDLTGKTSGVFGQNTISGTTMTLAAPSSTVTGNQLTQATVTHAGTTAGAFTFSNNVMLTGSLTVNAATTAAVTFNNNVVGGQAGGYRVAVTGKTGSAVTVNGNRFFNQGAAAQELLIGGAGSASVTASEISMGDIRLNGPAAATVASCNLSGVTVTTGPGVLNLSGLNSGATTVTHSGSGTLTVSNSTITGTTVTTGASSTRGLTLDETTTRSSSVTQNGTASANTDGLTTGAILHRATVTFASTSAATPNGDYRGVVIDSGGVLNVASVTAAIPVENAHINNGATVNLSGAGTLVRTRVDSQAVLNTAFPAVSGIVEGVFTVTTTTANTGRLANAAYSDWV